MIFLASETNEWINSLGMDLCKKDLQSIVEKDGCSNGTRFFDKKIQVLDGDCIEGKLASQEKRNPNKSMDCLFLVENKGKIEILLVELRCNYTNLKNVQKGDLTGKLDGSKNAINKFGNSYPLHEIKYFIFASAVVQQARRRFRNINPKLPSSFVVSTLGDLKSTVDFT